MTLKLFFFFETLLAANIKHSKDDESGQKHSRN